MAQGRSLADFHWRLFVHWLRVSVLLYPTPPERIQLFNYNLYVQYAPVQELKSQLKARPRNVCNSPRFGSVPLTAADWLKTT